MADLTCCFTGKRPKGLFPDDPSLRYSRQGYIGLFKKLKEFILTMYESNYKNFITGGAQGVDQMAFWAVNALKRDNKLDINNIVYVPFKNQDRIWKETGLFGQKEYGLMIRLADKVLITYEYGVDFNKAFTERNHKMIDDSDFVLAVSNSDNYLEGGTGEAIKYTIKNHKPVGLLDFKTLEYVKNNSDLAKEFIIFCKNKQFGFSCEQVQKSDIIRDHRYISNIGNFNLDTFGVFFKAYYPLDNQNFELLEKEIGSEYNFDFVQVSPEDFYFGISSK